MTWEDRKLFFPRSYQEYLLTSSAHQCHCLRGRCHRCRGESSGQLAKLKAYLVLYPGIFRIPHGVLAEYGSAHHCFVSWRFLDPFDTWLVPVVGVDEEIQLLSLCSPLLCLPRDASEI